MSKTTKGNLLFAAVITWLASGLIHPGIPLLVLGVFGLALLWGACHGMFSE